MGAIEVSLTLYVMVGIFAAEAVKTRQRLTALKWLVLCLGWLPMLMVAAICRAPTPDEHPRFRERRREREKQ